jgi:ribosomal protein S27E
MIRGDAARASGASGAIARRITCPGCGRALGLWMNRDQLALAAGVTLLGFDDRMLVVRCPGCARAVEAPAPARPVTTREPARSRPITCSMCGQALAIRQVDGDDPSGRGWTDTLRLAPAVGAGGMQVRAGRLHVKCPTCGAWAEEPDLAGGAGGGDG